MAVTLCSCVISIPITKYENEPYLNNFDFLSKEYKVIGPVEYTTSHTYVLGIGGFKDRRKNAVEELYKSANLSKRQQVVNISTNSFVNVIVCGLVVQKKTTAKGTLIEYTDGDYCSIQPATSNITVQKIQQPEPQIEPTEPALAFNTDDINAGDVNNIKFKDKAFTKACLAIVDTNKDGKITDKEVLAVTKLDVNFWGIENMEGIELFKNLEELDATRNMFKEIDLSKNTRLKTAKLQSSKLKKVYLFESQDIRIDVPGLIQRK